MFDFFKSLFKPPASSGETAKERLRLVLLSDHLSLAPDVVDSLKRDLMEVISRYVEIDTAHADVTFEHREREIAMLASIPITAVRDRPAPQAPPAPSVSPPPVARVAPEPTAAEPEPEPVLPPEPQALAPEAESVAPQAQAVVEAPEAPVPELDLALPKAAKTPERAPNGTAPRRRRRKKSAAAAAAAKRASSAPGGQASANA